MALQNYNTINVNYLGKLYDWGSISLNLLGSLQIGINSIDIKETRASTNIYGYGQLPTGYINKNVDYSATLGLLYDTVQLIVEAALAQGYKLYQIPPFQIIMTLGGTQDPSVTYKIVTLNNCRFTTNDFTAKQGEGGIYLTYPIAYAGCIES